MPVIRNSAASGPVSAQVTTAPASGSAATTAPARVAFSSMLNASGPENAGGSSTSVIVTVTAALTVSRRPPSPPAAVTVTA